MKRIRSALFLDFDNIFSGLLALDRRVAFELAGNPMSLVNALSAQSPATVGDRQFLVLRAYINPAGSIPDGAARIYFSKYRPYFVRAGFEVVDCPSLTASHKNASDIRMVLDVIDCMAAGIRYEEFVIASGDSDFAPLLQRLKADDRLTTIVSAGTPSAAYSNIADMHIDEQDLVEMIVQESPPSESAGERLIAQNFDSTWGNARDEAWKVAMIRIQSNQYPTLLSELGSILREKFGDTTIDQSRWFGRGTLGAFLKSGGSDGPDITIKGHYVYIHGQHSEPADEEAAPSMVILPSSIEDICRITDVPRLDADCWPSVFDTLADYGNREEFNITECTAWVRDELARKNIRVGRKAIGVTVRGALIGGQRIDSTPSPSADDIREAFIESIINRAEALQFDVDRDMLSNWLKGGGVR